jgi:predicted transcriptional regulator
MITVAKDIMTPNIKSVPETWNLQQFARFLSDNDISGSPVVNENGDVIGIATLKDIADFHFNSVTNDYESKLSEDERIESRKLRQLIFEGLSNMPVEVRDIMTPIVFSVNERDSIKSIATLMMKEHLHRVFVKNDQDKVTGIITTYDLLKIITDLIATNPV